VLLGVGAIAGAAGSAGGITSLVSYPALLGVGLSPLSANVTQAVAFVASWPGSAAGSRPELAGRAPLLKRWAPLIAVGSAAGVALLLCIPAATFARVVPYLLILASATLLLQPRLSARRAASLRPHNRFLLPAGLFALSVYSGYFGAGAGIMALTLALVAIDDNIVRANALKNMLLGLADLVAAIGLAVFGPVDWAAAAPLALGMLVGSRIGPSLTRAIPPGLLRLLVALAGVGLAVRLWIVPA
jgi:hypothetical protein